MLSYLESHVGDFFACPETFTTFSQTEYYTSNIRICEYFLRYEDLREISDMKKSIYMYIECHAIRYVIYINIFSQNVANGMING